MAETLCDSGTVKLLAGSNVSTALTGANYTTLINQAESDVSAEMKEDLVAGYSGYNANKKLILETATAAHAARAAIGYDMLGYINLREAQTLMDLNHTRYIEAMKKLKSQWATS